MIPLFYLIVFASLAGYFLLPGFAYRNFLPGVAVACVALIFLLRLVSGGRENLNYLEDFEYAVGFRLGSAVAESDPGVLLLLVPSPDENGETRGREELITGFRDALGDVPVSLRIIDNPNLPSSTAIFGVDPGIFQQALKEHPDANGVASLVGLPSNQPQFWPGLPLWAREDQMNPRVRSWLSAPFPTAVVTLQEEYDRLARPQGRKPLADFSIRYTLHKNAEHP